MIMIVQKTTLLFSFVIILQIILGSSWSCKYSSSTTSFLSSSHRFRNDGTVECNSPLSGSLKSLQNIQLYRRRGYLSFFSKNNNDDDNAIFYNDFDFDISNNDNDNDMNANFSETNEKTSNMMMLQELIQQSKEKESSKTNLILQNWSEGNWKVRGFVLDKHFHFSTTSSSTTTRTSDENGPTVVHISKIAFSQSSQSFDSNYYNIDNDNDTIDSSLLLDDDHDDLLVVGRTDGSIIFVRLGTESIARFTSSPTISTTTSTNHDAADSNSNTSDTFLRIETQLKRDEEYSNRIIQQEQQPPNNFNNDSDDTNLNADTPFQILSQFQAHDPFQCIGELLFLDGDTLYTSSTSSSSSCHTTTTTTNNTPSDSFTREEMIKVWQITEDFNTENDAVRVTPLNALNTVDVHSPTNGNIIAIKSLSSSLPTEVMQKAKKRLLILTVSSDGSFALWDKNNNNTLVCKCQIPNDLLRLQQQDRNDNYNAISNIINCADVDVSSDPHQEQFIYLGLSSGIVLGYSVSSILQHPQSMTMTEQQVDKSTISAPPQVEWIHPQPNCRFLAHDPNDRNSLSSSSTGVTSILSCSGKGSSSSSMMQNSSVLITGGGDGTIKQWEIMKRKISTDNSNSSSDNTNNNNNWKLEHWPRLTTQRMKHRAHLFIGHEGPITTIQTTDPSASKILSAGEDGTIRFWSSSTGKELYRMGGFDKSVVNSLCLDKTTLITNGMGEVVCVHDFDIQEDDYASSYDLEF